jgi:SAM-dependent methyltransferase
MARVITRLRTAIYRRSEPFWSFLDPNSLAINDARIDHLRSLELPLAGKSVLEVGAGIGLLTGFFEEQGCRVLSTDARLENLAEIKRRYPQREVARLDLEHPEEVAALGQFDVVFCYGTLYHLGTPEAALRALSEVSDLILVESSLSAQDGTDVIGVEESSALNQAFSRRGSRPTRSWVLAKLSELWGHGYISLTQPAHPEFPLDWSVRNTAPNTRAVFVGSKAPLTHPLLSATLPRRHRRTAD